MAEKNNEQASSGSERKRGRPTGHNRRALTQMERRARNAQYERERRNEQTEAILELAREMGCEAKIKLAELLTMTITRLAVLQQQPQESIRELKAQIETLKEEISELDAKINKGKHKPKH